MTLMRRNQRAWDPFRELETLQNEMSRLFDLSLSKRGNGDFFEGNWSPAVDIQDARDSIIVKADLPGLNKEDIQVSVEDGQLILKGEKKEERKTEEKGYVRMERTCGAFYRAISLPASIESDKVKATYKNGVLELVLPKKEEAKPKQIAVEVK